MLLFVNNKLKLVYNLRAHRKEISFSSSIIYIHMYIYIHIDSVRIDSSRDINSSDTYAESPYNLRVYLSVTDRYVEECRRCARFDGHRYFKKSVSSYEARTKVSLVANISDMCNTQPYRVENTSIFHDSKKNAV